MELNFNKIIIIFAILMLVFSILFKPLFFVSLIILSVILSYCLGAWHIRGIGVELVLLITVLTGFAYGPWPAVILGFILITFHMVVSQHLGVYLLWVIPAYSAVGFFAGTTAMSIARFGIFATFALNAFNFLVTLLIMRENVGKFLPFAITNVAFNAVVFMFVAPNTLNFVAG
ncbi:MAG: hypothetical protein V1900_01130 [Candidatus Aenigmatarchaeota archaeon]